MKTIDELKELYLQGGFDSPLYSGKNEDNCDVIVNTIENGFKISTYQKNGWIRADIYEYDNVSKNWTYTESYDGKWQ